MTDARKPPESPANAPLTLEILDAISAIPAANWDACTGDDNPFLSHAFLRALEESGSVAPETGWLPQHLVLRDAAGRVRALCPLYLKSHSYGEYVFDWGWAEAFERAGGRYYPKLQCQIPFTPVPGRRLLCAPGADDTVRASLIGAMKGLADALGVSSLHLLHPQADEWQALGTAGFLTRLGRQYHWRNRGYEHFEDFLAELSARKRKMIRRERRAIAESGLEIKVLSGEDLRPSDFGDFHGLYIANSRRKWGQPYLNRDFFRRIGEAMGEKILLLLACDRGTALAGALNFIGKDRLYGRNWGARAEVPFLHFELCYYRAIDFAIARGLSWVEAGVQGEHKIQRGYLPVETYSAHYIRDPRLREAVARYLAAERQDSRAEIDYLSDFSPFRKGDRRTDSR